LPASRTAPTVPRQRQPTSAPPRRYPRPDDAQTALLPRHDEFATPAPAPESVTETRTLGVVGVAPIETGDAAHWYALAHLAWLLSTLAAGVIGLIRISWPAAWADELATWGMATTSWSRMWGVLQHTDVTIGPYYAFMHVWASVVGASDFELRLPSVLAMAGAAGLIARIGTRLATPRIGLVSGLLFAVIPITSRYAQEARPYAMVVFAACLCSLALVRALERPRFGPLALYALSIVLLGALHVIALLLLAAHALVVLAVRRRALWRWLVAAVLGVLPALPVLYLGRQQTAQVSWLQPVTLGSLTSFPNLLVGASIVAGMLMMLALFAVSTKHPAILYTAWALVPMIALFVAAQFTPLWLPRYLLFTLPAWVLLAGTALGGTRVVRGVVAVALIGAVGLSAQAAFRAPDGHTQATRDVAKLLIARGLPTDGIVFGTNDKGGGWTTRDLVAHYVPASKRPADVLLVTPPRTNGHVLATECADVAKCLNNRPRLWIVRLGRQTDPLANLGGTKQSVIGHLYYASQVWYPKGLTVALMMLKPTG
jgi:mannosyltransferase